MFEIRNYHYDPSKLELYKTWAIEEAVPYLKEHMDVVGFWVDNGETPQLSGSDPFSHKHGAANITWIIRWDSMGARDKGHARVFKGKDWQTIWGNHPDTEGYLQIEAKFMDEI